MKTIIQKLNTVRGITVMELLITVVIIGIVSAMAVPRMQTAYERMGFKGSVRELTSTLRMARSMAISKKGQYGIYFDPTAMTVTLFEDLVNTSTPDFVTGDSVIRIDTLPPEFSTLSTDVVNNVFVFRSNGSASFAGTGNIISLATTNNMVAISQTNILASTGRVSTDLWVY